MELTVLMPCLNEAETVETCVRKAVSFLVDHRIDGEVLVADNGSTDGSQQLAKAAGARVVRVREPGYGNALLGGIKAAHGQYVIMGDADDSYDFSALMPFIERLRDGADLVMGNRFQGGIERGAMPALHRYLGNPVLSFLGRLFFGIEVGDFHCGLRGFRRDSALSLGLQTAGMEFASEMVVKAALAGQRMEEVPTVLSQDGRSRPPHLRSWRDGWRHLRFLLLLSPRWLFIIPGSTALAVGVILAFVLMVAPVPGGQVRLDAGMLTAACAMIVTGLQAVLCGLFSEVYASAEGLLPANPRVTRFLAAWNLERGLWASSLLALAGVVGLATAVFQWPDIAFGHLDHDGAFRVVIPAATAVLTSCQMILGTFFLSVLGIRRTRLPLAGSHSMDVLGEAAQLVTAPTGLAAEDAAQEPSAQAVPESVEVLWGAHLTGLSGPGRLRFPGAMRW